MFIPPLSLQHIASKKHLDKLNPKPPPPPAAPKTRGVGKPKINFVKASASDAEYGREIFSHQYFFV